MVTATKNGKAAANRVKAAEADALESPKEKGKALRLVITPLRERIAAFKIVGSAPLMMCKFSTVKFNKMKEAQEAGSQKGARKERTAREFDKDFREASYVSREGWHGIPAASFRNGMVSTCKMCGFHMSKAKMSIFIEADGYDAETNDPLVRIHSKAPIKDLRPARNDNGSCDIRARPIYENWSVVVRIRWDEDQFSITDIANLLHRMGCQNGVGEGRAKSKKSTGMGFGSFVLEMK